MEADNGNRTRDLRLTKATLYRLSHISIVECSTPVLFYYVSLFLSSTFFIFSDEFMTIAYTLRKHSIVMNSEKKNSLSIGCSFRRRYFYYGV